MKSEQRPKEIRIGSLSIKRKILILLGICVIAIPILYYFYNHSFLSPRNYAAEVAKPLEDALVKAGAVKKCTQGDNGRTIDNRQPWYSAYYEIPGNINQATEKIHTAFEKADLRLSDGPYPPNPLDNKFYSDESSKRNPYSDLNEGSVQYLVTIYGQTNKNGVCGQPLSSDRTTFYLTINLPAFKQ